MQRITLTTPIIFSSKEDEESLLESLKGERLAFNEAAKLFPKLKKKSIVDLHSLFYEKFRKAHPRIPSQIAIQGERAALAALKSAKSNKHKGSIFEKKRLSWQLDQRTYTPKVDGATITTPNGRVKVKLHRYPHLDKYLEAYEQSDPKIFERDGRIYIALVFKIPTIQQDGDVLGIDLGERNFITTSDGKIFRDKAYLRERRKIRFLKRQLQAQKKSSTAKRHLKKLRKREANISKDFCHRAANAVLNTKAKIIAIEDLSKIKKSKKESRALREAQGKTTSSKQEKRSNNRKSQIPYYQFRQILTYKALLSGKEVATVNPRFTSQVDHRTHRRTGERKGRRYYAKDRVILDADVNAAINIAYKAARVSANRDPQRPVLSCMALDGQALVNELNVGAVKLHLQAPKL